MRKMTREREGNSRIQYCNNVEGGLRAEAQREGVGWEKAEGTEKDEFEAYGRGEIGLEMTGRMEYCLKCDEKRSSTNIVQEIRQKHTPPQANSNQNQRTRNPHCSPNKPHIPKAP